MRGKTAGFKHSARFQPSQPGLTKAAGIAGNEANSLATHGMKRGLDRVKPTGASWYVCAKAGGLRRLQPFTGAASWAHIWCNLRRWCVASPGSWKGRVRWREAGRQCKRQQTTNRAVSEEEKGFGKRGAKGLRSIWPIKLPNSTIQAWSILALFYEQDHLLSLRAGETATHYSAVSS